MFLFCEAKAKTTSRGREIFPSGKILVTTVLKKEPIQNGFFLIGRWFQQESKPD